MSTHALLVFGLLVGLVLTAGVGVDARSRDRSWVRWSILTFFTGLLGAFVYAFTVVSADGSSDDPDHQTRRVCPTCSARHSGTPAFCSSCGDALDPDDDAPVTTLVRSGAHDYCENCKSTVDRDTGRCGNCGAVF